MDTIIKKADKIIEANTGVGTHCVLALIDFDDYPTASTITASKAIGIEELFFCTGINSNKTNRIISRKEASVCFTSGEYNITLKGSIDVLKDEETKKEMWYSGLENHFDGPEDPQYCVLHFTTEEYNLLVDWEEVRGKV